MTCSVGGWYSEIPQLFVGQEYNGPFLFTALLDSTREHMLDTTVDEKGFTKWNPIFSWDKDKKMYVLNRNVPVLYLSYLWEPDRSGKALWDSSEQGLVPSYYFDKNELKEGLI